jgi:hypothetical protein
MLASNYDKIYRGCCFSKLITTRGTRKLLFDWEVVQEEIDNL